MIGRPALAARCRALAYVQRDALRAPVAHAGDADNRFAAHESICPSRPFPGRRRHRAVPPVHVDAGDTIGGAKRAQGGAG